MTSNNLRFVFKIMLLVAVMALTTRGIGYIGYSRVLHLGAAGRQIDDADGQALHATRLNQAMEGLNRAEYRLAVDPPPSNEEEVKVMVAKIRGEVHHFIGKVRAA